MFLGTGTMVVCLKHVGITDSDRERLKMSVKTLDRSSAHARPGNPCGLENGDLFKGLTSAAESMDTQSSGTADALMHVSVLLMSRLSCEEPKDQVTVSPLYIPLSLPQREDGLQRERRNVL